MSLFKIHEHNILIARQNVWNAPATTDFYNPIILAEGLEINSELNRIKEYEIIGSDFVENSKRYETGVGENNLYRIKIKFYPIIQNLTLILNFTPYTRSLQSQNFIFSNTPHKINYYLNEGRFLTLIAKTHDNLLERYYNGVCDNFSFEYDFKTKETELTAEFIFTKKDIITVLPSSTPLYVQLITITNYETEPENLVLLNKISINENFNFNFDEVFLTYKKSSAYETFSLYNTEGNYETLTIELNNIFYFNFSPIIKREPIIINDYLYKKITWGKAFYYLPQINNI